MLGKIEGSRRRGQEKMRWLDEMKWHRWLNGDEFEQTPGDSEGQGSRCAAVHGVAKSQTRLSNWTATITVKCFTLECPLPSKRKTVLLNKKKWKVHMENIKNIHNLLLHGKASEKQSRCYMINRSNGCLIGMAVWRPPKLNALNRERWNIPGEWWEPIIMTVGNNGTLAVFLLKPC